MIKREFLLSLGVTVLVSGLLFMYFRNRFKHVEHKVNTMFQLVQNHVRQQAPVMQPRATEELIEVSDDDSDSDSDESDSDDDDEIKNLDIKVGQLPNMLPNPISFTKLPGTLDIQIVSKDLDDVGSLSDSDNNSDDSNDNDDHTDRKEELLEEKSVETPSELVAEEAEEAEEETVNYSKLTVAKLKEIAESKGYSNFKKLRKQGLVDLLNN